MPRSRSVARFACVAASLYMRSFIAGATARGAVQARNEVVSIESAMPGRELGDRVGRGRGDQVGVGVADDREVADRVVVGGRVARERAAHRVALELVDQHRRADDALERRGADEPAARPASSARARRDRRVVASRASSSAL